MDNIIQNLDKICRDLYPYSYSITGKDSERASEVYLKHLPFKIHTFKSGETIRGWTIPEEWKAKSAKVKREGKIIYDCLHESKLGCPVLCPPFKGKVTKQELIEHCCWREDLENATVYDWTRLYRPAKKEWGLSIPWEVLKRLKEEDYDIEIETETSLGKMLVYDFYLKGSSQKEIIFNAHNCHPYQANDDISGCAVGIEIFKLLAKMKNRKYSYRLLIAPELFGPIFWAEKMLSKEHTVSGCILLKSVGNNERIKIQKSYSGETLIDKALEKAVSDITGKK